MKKTFKQILNWISGILVGLVVLLAIALVGVRFAGFEVFSVLSGSMEPQYSTGDLLYVRSVDYTTLKAGDVITYMLSEKTIATHRIVEVLPDDEDPSTVRYRTKGDANDNVDAGLVHYKNVIGTPRFSIPLLGYVASYISAPPGIYVAVGACATLIMMVFLPDLFGKEDKNKKKGRYVGRYERLDER